MQIKKRETLNTDILIIGGGTAGCYAALTIAEKSGYSVLIAEKANIKRSGCLAAGVNVINIIFRLSALNDVCVDCIYSSCKTA